MRMGGSICCDETQKRQGGAPNHSRCAYAGANKRLLRARFRGEAPRSFLILTQVQWVKTR